MRPFPQGMSPACISFVSAMMIRDVQQRPSAKQLLQHPIVLTYLRTLVPAQQPAVAPLAPTSDSASSLNGSAAMPRPLFAIKRPAQGTSASYPVSVPPYSHLYTSSTSMKPFSSAWLVGYCAWTALPRQCSNAESTSAPRALEADSCQVERRA